MPISQTTVTGSVKLPSGGDAQLTGISFKLSGSDFEAGELIAVNTTAGTVTTEAGDFTVNLWPNDKGLDGGTTYTVTAQFSDGSTLTNVSKIYVPSSETDLTIEDVSFAAKLLAAFKGYKIAMMTSAQYNSLTTKDPKTVYVILAVPA